MHLHVHIKSKRPFMIRKLPEFCPYQTDFIALSYVSAYRTSHYI